MVLFIYLFLAGLGLRCCSRAFPSCRVGATIWVRCSGFSLQGLLLQSTGARARRSSSCVGLVALQHVGSSWARDLTGVPAWQGGFLLLDHQGSPKMAFFKCVYPVGY